MTSPVTVLTELAVSTYKTIVSDDLQSRRLAISTGDTVLEGFLRLGAVGANEPDLDRAVKALTNESDLTPISCSKSELGVVIIRDDSCARDTFQGIINSLLVCAARNLYVLDKELSESAFVSAVLDNYEELKRAVQGQTVRVNQVTGFSGIKLQQGALVKLPWGTLHSAPEK